MKRWPLLGSVLLVSLLRGRGCRSEEEDAKLAGWLARATHRFDQLGAVHKVVGNWSGAPTSTPIGPVSCTHPGWPWTCASSTSRSGDVDGPILGNGDVGVSIGWTPFSAGDNNHSGLSFFLGSNQMWAARTSGVSECGCEQCAYDLLFGDISDGSVLV